MLLFIFYLQLVFLNTLVQFQNIYYRHCDEETIIILLQSSSRPQGVACKSTQVGSFNMANTIFRIATQTKQLIKSIQIKSFPYSCQWYSHLLTKHFSKLLSGSNCNGNSGSASTSPRVQLLGLGLVIYMLAALRIKGVF